MSTSTAIKSAALAYVPSSQGKPRPREYAHVVFRSYRVDEMIDWYCEYMGMQVVMRTTVINFLTWDDSQDRLAIISLEGTKPVIHAEVHGRAGLDHVAFAFDRLADVVAIYRSMQRRGASPHWCVNHGVATSMYFHDPDGNLIELSVEHFHDRESLNAWLETGAFNTNPIGVTLDPDALAERVESGEDEAVLLAPHPRHAEVLEAEIALAAQRQQARAGS